MGRNPAFFRRWIMGLNRLFPSLKFLSCDEWNFLVFEERRGMFKQTGGDCSVKSLHYKKGSLGFYCPCGESPVNQTATKSNKHFWINSIFSSALESLKTPVIYQITFYGCTYRCLLNLIVKTFKLIMFPKSAKSIISPVPVTVFVGQ